MLPIPLSQFPPFPVYQRGTSIIFPRPRTLLMTTCFLSLYRIPLHFPVYKERRSSNTCSMYPAPLANSRNIHKQRLQIPIFLRKAQRKPHALVQSVHGQRLATAVMVWDLIVPLGVDQVENIDVGAFDVLLIKMSDENERRMASIHFPWFFLANLLSCTL